MQGCYTKQWHCPQQTENGRVHSEEPMDLTTINNKNELPKYISRSFVSQVHFEIAKSQHISLMFQLPRNKLDWGKNYFKGKPYDCYSPRSTYSQDKILMVRNTVLEVFVPKN